MNEAIQNKLLQLAEVINYPKHDLHLLEIALTHRSVGDPNNERLEFLGDSILNFLIGAELYDRLPLADEGTLTRLRAQLVKKETLIELANAIHLGDYVILGPGEKKTGGHQRGSILADTFEAIIGCMFCTVGIAETRDLILHYYHIKLADITGIEVEKDPKTTLQELLQAKKLHLPEYEVKQIIGPPHEQTFQVVCKTVLTDPVIGLGSSRRKAEQDAAEKVLKKLVSN